VKPVIIIAIAFVLLIPIPIFADDDFSIKLDKNVYFLRDTLTINGNLDKIVPDEHDIKFEVINPRGVVVDRFEIQRNKVDLDFTHSFSLIENIWNEEGLYRIKASYVDTVDSAYFHLFQTDTGMDRQIDSTIGLDQKQYGWTDTVEIFVVAPNFNRDNDRIERIGLGGELTGDVIIKTSKGILKNYELMETEIDSGIFFGTVFLTGDALHDANGDGIKKNDAYGTTERIGSENGKIAARGSDTIDVIFKNENEEIKTTAKISWVLAEFGEIPEQISEIENIEIKIYDADMNLKHDHRDTTFVLAWSDRDDESKKITLRETHENSGIFEGVVKLSTERSGLSTIKTRIPDVLYLKYSDNTVPTEVSQSHTQFVDAQINIGKSPFEEFVSEPELVIPTWIRNNAKWYADGLVGESDFTQGIGYMIKNDIMRIPELPERSEGSVASGVPDWVKNNAKWWADGQISDGDFVKGIQYLVKQGIIQIN
jgi:hypothetical protein